MAEVDERIGYRPGLDQLRGIAVLMVIVGHTTEDIPMLEATGSTGVLVFFVLSGFLITRLMLEERERNWPHQPPSFYARRARRLLPALGMMIPLGVMVNIRFGNWVRVPVISTLTYTANFASIGHDHDFQAFTHLWSLSVEEHFYFLWPLLVILLGRRRLVPFCVAAIAAVVVFRYLHRADPAVYRATQFRIDAMMIGALASLVVRRFRRPPRLLVVACWAVVALFCHQALIPAAHAWGYGLLAVASAVLVLDGLHWRETPVLRRIGVLSYGIYLYHLPLQLLLRPLGLTGGWLTLSTLAVTLVVAEASYRYVEQPFLRHRSVDRSPAPEVTARMDRTGARVTPTSG